MLILQLDAVVGERIRMEMVKIEQVIVGNEGRKSSSAEMKADPQYCKLTFTALS